MTAFAWTVLLLYGGLLVVTFVFPVKIIAWLEKRKNQSVSSIESRADRRS